MKDGRTVLEAKRYGLTSCRRDTPLREVASKMVDRDINTLVVLNAGDGLEGIITRADLLHAYVQHADWKQRLAEQHMTSNVMTVPTDMQLTEVPKLLVEQHIHQVVVVDARTDRPVALLSAADLVYHMLKEN